MTVRPILLWPDARLTMPCDPVTSEGAALIGDLFETMYAAQGRGLAAPQIGVLQRAFVMDAGWKAGSPKPMAFLNPRILSRSNETTKGPEGCLSIPGLVTEITRATGLTLAWAGPDGAELASDFTGFEAVCIQHEMDHLDGRVTFDHLAAPDREQAEQAYAAGPSLGGGP